MNGMLSSAAPASLPPLITSQAFSSSSLADSSKRFWEAWPAGVRSDLLLEPTSVLDIRSPSPSSTLSSSLAGSCEGGLGSIESGAVAISGLFDEPASEGQLVDCTSLLDANEVTVWEIAQGNGRQDDEQLAMGVGGWQGDAEIGANLGWQWEKISQCQETRMGGDHNNAEGLFGGVDAGGGSIRGDMLIGSNMGAAMGNNNNNNSNSRFCVGAVVQEVQRKWGEEGGGGVCKVQKVEQFSYTAMGMLGNGLGKGVAEGEVVMNETMSRVGGVAEEWLADWNEVQMGGGATLAEKEKAAPVATMVELEDILSSPLVAPPPAQELWWVAEEEAPPPPPPPMFQGFRSAGGARLQLDLHEALLAATPPNRASTLPSISATFRPQLDSPPSFDAQKFHRLPPHHFQVPPPVFSPNAKLLPHPRYSSTPSLPNPAPRPQLPFQIPPPQHVPATHLFPLPFHPPKSEHLLPFPNPEVLQKHSQWQLDAARWQPQQHHHQQHLMLKHPTLLPDRDRVQPQIVGRAVLVDELFVAANQLNMAADAAEHGNLAFAQAILARLNQHNPPDGQPSQRAIFLFKEALIKRLAGSPPASSSQQCGNSPIHVISKISAYKSFCESSPVPQFAHFTANQAILEAVEGEDRVHLIDFDLGLGGQWASFMQEISQRSKGPPELRITTLGSTDSMEMHLTRENLNQFARDLNISLDFRVLPITQLDCLTASAFQLGENEAIAVNFGAGLNRLLADFSSNDCIVNFLQLIKNLSPRVVTVVENEFEYEGSLYFESLQFHACLFESLEASIRDRGSVSTIESLLFAPKITSLENRRRRMENLPPWRNLLQRAGFSPRNFSNAAENQARCLLRCKNEFTFDKRQGCLLLGWHTRTLVSASTWV